MEKMEILLILTHSNPLHDLVTYLESDINKSNSCN